MASHSTTEHYRSYFPTQRGDLQLCAIPRHGRNDVCIVGGQAIVYCAWHSVLNTKVALKRAFPGGANSNDSNRLQQESTILQSLKGDGIVSYIENGSDESGPYVILEWIDGNTLHTLLESHQHNSRPAVLTWKVAQPWCLQICKSLQRIHEAGWLHRDLTLSNVMICSRTNQAKLIDLGLAIPISPGARLTGTGQQLGTRGYIPPEYSCNANPTIAGDIFTLGVTLNLVAKACEGVPEALSQIITSCLSHNPADRPQSATHLITAFTASTENLRANIDKGQPRTSRPLNPDQAIRQDLDNRNQYLAAAAKHLNDGDLDAALQQLHRIPVICQNGEYHNLCYEVTYALTQKARLSKAIQTEQRLSVRRGLASKLSSIQKSGMPARSRHSTDANPVAQDPPSPILHPYHSVTARTLAWADYCTVPMELTAGHFRFQLLPPGTFKRAQQHIQISACTYLMTSLVTQQQWRIISPRNPPWDSMGVKRGNLLPATWVRWRECELFCDAVTAYLKKQSPIPWRNKNAVMKARLPTEAEWDWAMYIKPNGQNLFPFDASQQLSEWVNDWYAHDYQNECPPRDPRGPETGEQRVLKSRQWPDHRNKRRPQEPLGSVSFRICLDILEQS